MEKENKAFVDVEFDKYHEQEKILWSNQVTPFNFSVFIVWHIIEQDSKTPVRKKKVVVDI